MSELCDGIRKIVITVDSIDHQKFAWPRSLAMESKEFGQFIRPTLGVTCAIIHGFAVLFLCQKGVWPTIPPGQLRS